MIVICWTKGAAYIVAEIDGTVIKEKVAAIWVLLHVAQCKPIVLPDNIHKLINLNSEQLDALVEDLDEEPNIWKDDYIFNVIPHLCLPITGEVDFNKVKDDEWDWQETDDVNDLGFDDNG